MSDNIIVSQFYAAIEKSLSVRANHDKLQNHIRRYIDRNSEVLFDKGLSGKLYFKPEDINVIFDVTGIHPQDVTACLKKNPNIDDSWKIFNFPYVPIGMLVLRYYTIKKDKQSLEQFLMYYMLSFYPSLHHKYFEYAPNENIMNYTINNLSNKFYLKVYGTLFKSLYVTGVNTHENYEKLLVGGTDKGLVDYVNGLRTRMNSFIKNVAVQYYDNWSHKKYLNVEKDSSDEESYNEVDNLSFQVNRITDRVTMRVLTGGIDHKWATHAANYNQVSVAAIREAVFSIVKHKDKEIRELILLIMQMYLVTGHHEVESIGSKKFIYECLSTYSKSNTIDEVVLKIKEILDKWLTETSDKYVKTERVATKSNFRRAIFLYFVFMIQQSYVSS